MLYPFQINIHTHTHNITTQITEEKNCLWNENLIFICIQIIIIETHDRIQKTQIINSKWRQICWHHIFILFYFVSFLLNLVFSFCRPIYNSWCLGKRFYFLLLLFSFFLFVFLSLFLFLFYKMKLSHLPFLFAGHNFATNISAFGKYFP